MKAAVPTGSLYYWHFADETATVPTLSESWLAEDKNNIDRALAVTSKLSRQIIADILVSNNCTRVMPLYSVPRSNRPQLMSFSLPSMWTQPGVTYPDVTPSRVVQLH